MTVLELAIRVKFLLKFGSINFQEIIFLNLHCEQKNVG